MSRKNDATTLRVSRRELATILAALRFHQDENLQGAREIPDQFIREISTNGGLLKPMTHEEVGKLCEELNIEEDQSAKEGLVIEPPQKEAGEEPLFRVVYVIDVNAASPIDAARHAHRIMADPESQPPVLEVIDHHGKTISIDLSEERPA
jgi:hypothetical protein